MPKLTSVFVFVETVLVVRQRAIPVCFTTKYTRVAVTPIDAKSALPFSCLRNLQWGSIARVCVYVCAEASKTLEST